jgi:hypothetical protein
VARNQAKLRKTETITVNLGFGDLGFGDLGRIDLHEHQGSCSNSIELTVGFATCLE